MFVLSFDKVDRSTSSCLDARGVSFEGEKERGKEFVKESHER